jgi:beta-mannosidase
MRRNRKLLILLLTTLLLFDVFIWLTTYRVATAPSAEEIARTAAVTPTPAPSGVDPGQIIPPQRLSLNGSWRYRQTGGEIGDYPAPTLDVTGWPTMTLPQNWYLAGLNYHGVIWFRRTFEADEIWRGSAIQLHFEGVDYFADVWLNGQHLGRHEGYFQSFAFPIHQHLNYGGQNTIAVRVESAWQETGTVWPDQKRVIKGIFGHHPTRPGGDSQSAGQSYNTGGVWNNIYLAVENAITIDGLQLKAEWPNGLDGDATLTMQLQLTNHTTQPTTLTTRITLTPFNFDGPTITLPPHRQTIERGQTEVVQTGLVESPHLWQPWDRGHSNLYTAHLVIRQDDQIIAQKETRFGFRRIEIQPDGRWRLNGEPYFPRGSHYTSSQWLSQTDAGLVRRDLQLMRQANLNTVYLTAHVEPASFYRAADEAGMLIWQDFPLYGGYADTPAFADNAQRQLADMVDQLYNHPSIVIWNVHNRPPWASSQGRSGNRNQRLDRLLVSLAQELDPTRPVYGHNPSGAEYVPFGRQSGHWTDFSQLPDTPLILEFGAQALPQRAALERVAGPDALAYDAAEDQARWRFHGFQPEQTFQIAQIEPGQSLEAFIANSQAYQANLIQYAAETYRRAKYRPITGLFHFMFVDHWPAITPAVLDVDRRPKAGYQALQTAMQPILPSIQAPPPIRLDGRRWVYTDTGTLQFAFWVVNDTLAPYPNARLAWRIEAEAGDIHLNGARPISIAPDQSRRWRLLRNLSLPAGNYQLHLDLFDADNIPLGKNTLTFAIAPTDSRP